jgi:hypothetical protein
MDSKLSLKLSKNIREIIQIRTKRAKEREEAVRIPTPKFASYIKLPSLSPSLSSRSIKNFELPCISFCPVQKDYPHPKPSATLTSKQSLKSKNSPKQKNPSLFPKNHSQSPLRSKTPTQEISITSKKLHLLPSFLSSKQPLSIKH